METGNQISEMSIEDDSPEKAGVGGSIPSLATIKSTAYKPPVGVFIPFHSKTMARDDSPRLKTAKLVWLSVGSRFRPSSSLLWLLSA
jgi:hypothetical protein